MNISNIIIKLQELSDNSTSSYELMVLAKSIEKLKVGAIQTIATVNDLPTLPLEENGELFFVEADDDIYFNEGTLWFRFRPINELLSFGFNGGGGLGDNTVLISKSSPVTVVGGITNWSAISAGGDHSLGLTPTSFLYAWGYGAYGRLGNNSTINRPSPVTVVGNITNWSAISAGRFHSLGLTSSGVIYAWGNGGSGQLGDDAAINRSSPVTVVGGITNWSQISAGDNHNLGLTSSGILYAWGNNGNGRLGDGNLAGGLRSSPFQVVGGITNWSQISAGGSHSLGLTDTGVLYAWGNNIFGRLGDRTTVTKSSPVTVFGGITNWSQISAGGEHSLGLTDTGVLYAWGAVDVGQLGTNEASAFGKSAPVTVVGGITNWSQISAGEDHSLGLTDTGVLYAWGLGTYGRLGDDAAINRSSPVTVVGGITSWSQISAGRRHNLVLRTID